VKSLEVGTLRRVAGWLAARELWLLAPAAALILFGGRWAWAGLAVVALAWCCRWLTLGRLSLPTPLDPPIVALLVMAGVGLAASPAPAVSRAALSRLVLGIALYYGVVNSLTTARRLKQFTGIVIAGGVALAFLGLVGTSWATGNVRLLPLALYARLPQLSLDLADRNPFNPRVVGMMLAMLIPVALAVVLFGRTIGRRLLAAAACLLMLGVLLLAQSVQGLLGLAAASLFLLAAVSPWLLLLILPVAASWAWWLAHADLQGIARAALDIGNPAGIGVVLRLDIWSRALAMIRDLPFTGIGLDAFPLVQTNFYIGHLLGPEPHAHSLYLQVALDLGLPGLAAFLWLLAAWALSLARAHRRNPDRSGTLLLVGPAAGIVAMAAAGLIDTLWTAKPAVLMWVLLGMGTAAASLASPVEAGRRSHRSRRLAWAAVPAGLVLAAALAWIVPNANLGLVQAQRAILASRKAGTASAGALETAAGTLRRALARVPGDADVHRRLGSVLAWQGHDAEALDALRQAVALDGVDPLGRHAPFIAWRRRLAGEPPGDAADNARLVYMQWLDRFPARAEGAVNVALVWAEQKGDRPAAAAVLRAALARDATPPSILQLYLRQLEAAGAPAAPAP
jgi:putative inorganic carbon (HCO3(-)) transporter